MSKDEVQKLSDEDLESAWNEVAACMRSQPLKDSLTEMQKNILFVDFVNIGAEMDKRKLQTH